MVKQPKQILITGGAGYVGSVLVGQALRQGHRVTVLDNLSFGGSSLLSFWPQENFKFVHGDIRNSDDLSRALEGAEIVIHLAAIVGDPACAKRPEEATETNKTASEKLCSMAIEKGVRRFVFASTCSNYGRMNQADEFVDESSTLKPVSHYADLKVGFERYLIGLAENGFSPVCLRFATAYGLSPRPRFDLTLNEFTRELVFKRPLEIYGEQFWRPYCHVNDLAAAALLAATADHELVGFRAFNVGATDENYQKKSLVELILKHLTDRDDLVKYVHRDEDPRDYKVKFDLIKTILKFKPSKKVTDGIAEIVYALESGLIKNADDRQYQNL